MKRLVLIAAALLAAVVMYAQGSFENYPLPQNPDTLRILAVGNSFSDDGTEYLPSLLEGAGIHNVIVARLYIGGCSLERHCSGLHLLQIHGQRVGYGQQERNHPRRPQGRTLGYHHSSGSVQLFGNIRHLPEVGSPADFDHQEGSSQSTGCHSLAHDLGVCFQFHARSLPAL